MRMWKLEADAGFSDAEFDEPTRAPGRRTLTAALQPRMRTAAPPTALEAPTTFGIGALLGAGSRDAMERSFGTDLGAVRPKPNSELPLQSPLEVTVMTLCGT